MVKRNGDNMNIKFLKILCFGLVVVLCLSLIGCSGFKKGSTYAPCGVQPDTFTFDSPNDGAVTIKYKNKDSIDYANYSKEDDTINIDYRNGMKNSYLIFDNYLIEKEAISKGRSSFDYAIQNLKIEGDKIEGTWEYRYFNDSETFKVEFKKDGTYHAYVGKTWGVPQYKDGTYKIENGLLDYNEEKYLVYENNVIHMNDIYVKAD